MQTLQHKQTLGRSQENSNASELEAKTETYKKTYKKRTKEEIEAVQAARAKKANPKFKELILLDEQMFKSLIPYKTRIAPEVLEKIENGCSIRDTAYYYGISYSAVRQIIKKHKK